MICPMHGRLPTPSLSGQLYCTCGETSSEEIEIKALENRIANCQRTADEATREAEHLQERIETIRNRPEDTFEDGAVLLLYIPMFSNGDIDGKMTTVGSYRKIDGRWYSGNGNSISWANLMRRVSQHAASKIYSVAEMHELGS